MVSSVPPALKQPSPTELPDSRPEEACVPEAPTLPSGKEAPGGADFRQYFLNIYRSVTSIFEGLVVTKSWLFRRPCTVQYPDKIEKPVQEMLPATYRGILEVDLDLCTGCMLCTRACPIGTISLKVGKNPESGQREISQFDIDVGQCMFCGLCVEACRFGALVHTTEFEATVARPEDLVLRFADTPRPVAKHKPGQAPERRRAGTILCEVIPLLGSRKPVFRPEPRPEKPEEPKAAEKPAPAKAAEKPEEPKAAEKPAPAEAAEKPEEPKAAEKPAPAKAAGGEEHD